MTKQTADSAQADVLILGASFAGVELVHQLRRRRAGRKLSLVVVDRQAEHGYIPLVQERLVGRIDRAASSLPTRRYIESDGRARLVVGAVQAFDPERKEVLLGSGERLRGRFVVVALGSTLAPPPAIPGAGRFAGYKFGAEFDDACARLAAVLGPDQGAAPPPPAPGTAADPYREGEPRLPPGERPTIVVVGGGISGVELAGELAHLARERPPGWRAPRVVLVHAGARLLPTLSERAGRAADRHLRAQNVELRLSSRLVNLSESTAAVAPAAGGPVEQLPCALAFWAGGVYPAPVLAHLGLPRTPDGWLAVGPTLQCFPTARPTRPDIFALGDAARVVGSTGEWPTMQRAIECLWQAELAARNILTLAAAPPDYPKGVPPLRPHALREDFFHGVSLGAASLVVYGGLVLDAARLNTWFRRFLMRRYFARYR